MMIKYMDKDIADRLFTCVTVAMYLRRLVDVTICGFVSPAAVQTCPVLELEKKYGLSLTSHSSRLFTSSSMALVTSGVMSIGTRRFLFPGS